MSKSNWHARIVDAVVGVLILGLMLHVFIDVVLRNFFGITLQATTDYVTYWWMAPLTLLAFTSAEYAREHIIVDGLTSWFGSGAKRVFRWIADVLTIVVVALIGWFGLTDAIHQSQTGEYSGATGVLIWPPRFIVPVAAVSLIIAIVIRWMNRGNDESGAPLDAEAEMILEDMEYEK